VLAEKTAATLRALDEKVARFAVTLTTRLRRDRQSIRAALDHLALTQVAAVLAWRLSNTIDTAFCLEALQEALATFGKPEIFNTDQGAQFTSTAFTGQLHAAGIRISMDGRGAG